MAKPPKKPPSPGLSDNTSTTTRPHSEHTSLPGSRVPIDSLDLHWPVSDTPGNRPSDVYPDNNPSQEPAIIITDLPTVVRSLPEFPDDINIYQQSPDNSLMLLGDSGLSRSSQGFLYARIEHIGDVAIQINAKGQYEIATASPYVVGLSKIDGKPLWQKKNDNPGSKETDGSEPVATQTASLDELIIPNKFARTLTAPGEDGIRVHPSGRLFVDLFNNTTVMVVRTEGGKYQAKDSKSLDTYGPVLERIDETSHWQPEDSGPGPSKRPRLEQPVDTAHGAERSTSFTRSWEPNPHLWLTWGNPVAELTGSIKVNELHYKIFDFDNEVESRAVIKPPGFGDTFNDFERVLAETPWLQPVVASRNADGQWTVSSSPLFERSFSESVVNSFKDFSDITSADVAYQLFAHSSGRRSKPSSRSLLELSATLRQWENKSTERHSGPADPIQLLAVTRPENAPGSELLFRPPSDGQKLYRLDFNSEHFAQQWAAYKTTADEASLRQLFQTLLIRNGYDVFPTAHPEQADVLMFRCADHIYLMKLETSKGHSALYDFTSDPNNPHLLTNIGAEAHKVLIAADARNDIKWLKGSVSSTDAGVVISRVPRSQPDTNTVWNGQWRPDDGGSIQPFALIHSRHKEQFSFIDRKWIKQKKTYPFFPKEKLTPEQETTLFAKTPMAEETNAGNIKQKTELFAEYGMQLDVHTLSYFKVPGNVAAEVTNLNGGLIADLVNQKSNGEPAIQRIIEPMAGSGYYGNYARAVGFEGEMMINDLNPLISWTQKEIAQQPDRVKYYIEFIKRDLIRIGETNQFLFNSELAIKFASKEDAKAYIGLDPAPKGTPETLEAKAKVNKFRDDVRDYFIEAMQVIVEIKDGAVIISPPPTKGASITARLQDGEPALDAPVHSADDRAFLAAMFYMTQNSNQRNNAINEIRLLQNGKYTFHFPSNLMFSEGRTLKLFSAGLANIDHLNYIGHLHERAKRPTHFLTGDGWQLLDNLCDTTRNPSDLILLSGHFSHVYNTEALFFDNIKRHVVPLSNNGARIIITNSYSASKEKSFNELGFHTFKRTRDSDHKGHSIAIAKADYLLAINDSAMHAAQNL